MGDRLVETHCSTLFFVDDLVYKRKKPVDLGFVDFRTADARRVACEHEVALNRRLSPDVYLGVAAVLSPDGRPCDSLVVMRRLPDERRLAACVRRGDDVAGPLVALAGRLAELHRRSPAPEQLAHVGTAAFLGQLWETGLDALAGGARVIPPADLARTRRLALDYVTGRTELLNRRIDRGRLVDGHGDLLADDVFLLEDGPRALDCLEFDPQLRVGDAVADAAFLAMDLERLGRPDLGRLFLDAYEAAADDHPPSSLEHHYLAYRAHIRCKVAALRFGQTGDPADAGTARALADLALWHLQQGQPRLVVIGGAPGSGKSTLARGLAAQLGWEHLATDDLRADVVAPGPPSSGVHQGRYTAGARGQVYDELLRRAARLLELGESVVLDGTFTRSHWRAAARELARTSSAVLTEVRCAAPDEVVLPRLAGRAGSTSEATAGVRAALLIEAEPWPEATVLDTAPEDGAALSMLVSLMAGSAWGRSPLAGTVPSSEAALVRGA